MNTRSLRAIPTAAGRFLVPLFALAVLGSAPLPAQVPVDEDGNPVEAVEETFDPAAGVADQLEEAPLLSQDELDALVGPIALYPDKLLAIVLPASTYPLEIVQAARFLEQLESDKSLKPDESWDDSVTALLNYPEIVKMMNDDIDWTWRLGEAVVQQQADVIAAVESFRDRAYAAGNLKTDERQRVSNNSGAIEIEPLEEDIIYVPYYEPERVVHYQPRQVYYYYPRPYPVYYYPYPSHHSFFDGYFWGVTTAFRIGWATDHLHVFHHSYWGHPYYGRQYFGHWYRRPSITIYNNYYVNNHRYRPRDHHRDGDYWRPRDGGARPGQYWARSDRFRDHPRTRTREGYRDDRTERRGTVSQSGFRGDAGDVARSNDLANRTRGFAPSRAGSAGSQRGASLSDAADDARAVDRTAAADAPIRFRARDRDAAPARTPGLGSADTAGIPERSASGLAERRTGNDAIRFRARDPEVEPRRSSGTERAPATITRESAVRRETAHQGSARRVTSPPTQRAASGPTAAPPAVRPAPSASSGFRASPGRSAPVMQQPGVRRAPAVQAPQRIATPSPRASTPARAAPAPSQESRAASRRTPDTPPRQARTRNR